jgi:hypothetical protein
MVAMPTSAAVAVAVELPVLVGRADLFEVLRGVPSFVPNEWAIFTPSAQNVISADQIIYFIPPYIE